MPNKVSLVARKSDYESSKERAERIEHQRRLTARMDHLDVGHQGQTKYSGKNWQLGKDGAALAAAIVNISNAMDNLKSSGLKREAIVTLVHRKSGVARVSIEEVLDSLETLRKDFTTL